MTMQSASATDRDMLVLPRIDRGRRDTRGVLRRIQWSCASAAFATCLLGLTACGGSGRAAWPLPNLDLASTRALTSSGIDRDNVGSLRVAWRFRFRIPPGESGAFTATPVVADGVVYLQDMRSNVYALELKTGRLLWRRVVPARNPGPN